MNSLFNIFFEDLGMVDFLLMGAIGDGNLIRIALGVVVGCIIGWAFPQPAFVKKILNKSD